MRIREAKDEAAVVGPGERPEVEKMPSIEVEQEAEKEEGVVTNGVAVLNGGHDGFHRNGEVDVGERRKSSTLQHPVVEKHSHQKTGPVTTLLLQLAPNNNNNKENGEGSFPATKANPLLEVFQATVVESNGGGGGNGVFYERRVDDVIVVDADKRLFYCVRDAKGNGNA